MFGDARHSGQVLHDKLVFDMVWAYAEHFIKNDPRHCAEPCQDISSLGIPMRRMAGVSRYRSSVLKVNHTPSSDIAKDTLALTCSPVHYGHGMNHIATCADR